MSILLLKTPSLPKEAPPPIDKINYLFATLGGIVAIIFSIHLFEVNETQNQTRTPASPVLTIESHDEYDLELIPTAF